MDVFWQAYTPALLMPASVVLAAYGSVYGPQWVDTLLAISGIKARRAVPCWIPAPGTLN